MRLSAETLAEIKRCQRDCKSLVPLKLHQTNWSWSPETPWPPLDSVLGASFWAENNSDTASLRASLARPVLAPVLSVSEDATNLIIIDSYGTTSTDGNTGEQSKSGVLWLTPLHAAASVTESIAEIKFDLAVVHVPKLFAQKLNPLVYRVLTTLQKPLLFFGEANDVQSILTKTLDAFPDEGLCSVVIDFYDTLEKSTQYTMKGYKLAVVTANPPPAKVPPPTQTPELWCHRCDMCPFVSQMRPPSLSQSSSIHRPSPTVPPLHCDGRPTDRGCPASHRDALCVPCARPDQEPAGPVPHPHCGAQSGDVGSGDLPV